jgi:hypothetical protein
MNGDKQEGAHYFIQKLLPEIGADEPFEAVFQCKKNCQKCGKEMSASVTRSELLLAIPRNLERTENKVEFEHVLSKCLTDHSIFEFEKLQCHGCNEVGKWADAEGRSGKPGKPPARRS